MSLGKSFENGLFPTARRQLASSTGRASGHILPFGRAAHAARVRS